MKSIARITDRNLPIFLQNRKVREFLGEVVASIPKRTRVYLYGGSVRNAIFYRMFKRKLPQRDYDLIVIGASKRFIENLRQRGFTYGKTRRLTKVTMRKKKTRHPKGFSGYVYLDLALRKKGTIGEVLRERTNFTMNGMAVDLRRVVRPGWFRWVVSIPGAIADLRAMRVRTYKRYPLNLYACLRFVSQGFKVPPKDEMSNMVEDVRKAKWRYFKRDTEKLIRYVGSKRKAKQLVSRLGVKTDIFDFRSMQQKRPH